jgi:hypothetical protein
LTALVAGPNLPLDSIGERSPIGTCFVRPFSNHKSIRPVIFDTDEFLTLSGLDRARERGLVTKEPLCIADDLSKLRGVALFKDVSTLL